MKPNPQRSKGGCLTCRQKRKKCDEVRPACTRCARAGSRCVWPLTPCPREIPSSSSSSSSSRLSQLSPPNTTPGFSRPHNRRSSPCSLSNNRPAHHTDTNDLSLRDLDDFFGRDITEDISNTLGPGIFGLDSCPVYASELFPGLSPQSSQCALSQSLDGLVGFAPQTWQPNLTTFQYVTEDRRARLKYTFDEDEEETFKTAEWLPSTRYSIRTIIPYEQVYLSGAIDSYLAFLVRYCYDPAIITSTTSLIHARISSSESARLAMMSTANLFQLFLDPPVSPAILRRRAYELMDAAGDSLQAELLRPGTPVTDKLAGISEILNFQYYAGDFAGYQLCIDQAIPLVRKLIGTAPLQFHKLRGPQTIDIQVFVWYDVFSSIAVSRPTRLVYDCYVEDLLRDNQKGPNRTGAGLEWVVGLPDALLMLTIQIINLRHSRYSSTERTAQATKIEAALRDWKVWPSPITNPTMRVQRMSAQEIWRHFVILYLYQAIYKASSSNQVVQQSVKQIVQLASTLRPGRNPDCLLGTPYFIAGTFAVSTRHRHFLKTRILGCGIEAYAKQLTDGLEQVWNDLGDVEGHCDWTTKSPPIVVML